jgi:asparagine synthase (glutamine-hydrolysing)
MCGINGILYFDRERRPDRLLIAAMNQALAHRGPNDEGYYSDGPVALGNRRLSIIDRSAGHQPLSNEDGSVWITYNGEIYNHAELRRDLLAAGHVFKTYTDTEVIVHLYEEAGADCVQRLTGMFAFAIWDRRTATLLLARDRLGIKPLYYWLGPGFLAFSSEIRALLCIDSLRPRLDLQALHDYLTFRYNVAPQTMLQGVLKVPPGHLLVARGGDVKLRQYWDLDYSKKLLLSEDECIDEFRQRFIATTRSHLVGEVPLGVLLSGGLDSTAVTGVVSELTGRRVKTFSVAFAADGDDYDERRYARLAARHYRTEHHEIAITHKDFANGLADYIRSMEEPMADSASIPLYYVSKLAKDHVTIVLSGEGSDELFDGYMSASDFRGYDRARWIRKVPGLIRNHIVKPLNDGLVKSARLTRYLDLANRPLSHYPLVVPFYMGGGVFSEEAKRAIYGRRMDASQFHRSEALVVDLYRRTLGWEFLDQLSYVYSKQWLPDDLLLKADKMTMAHSLELRVPFLDHPLVEFVASLPVDMKMRRNGQRSCITKYILRKAFQDKTPPEIVHRQKMGFPVPLHRLFQHELREIAWDVLGGRCLRESGLFDTKKITTLLRENDAGIDRSPHLWTLLVFGLWYHLFEVQT